MAKARGAFPDVPPGEPRIDEAPDFLWTTPTGTIGIEVTDFIRGPTSQRITMRTLDQLQTQVANKAKIRFELQHQSSLMVHIHWNDSYHFTKHEVGTMSSDLAELVGENIPTDIYNTTVFDEEQCGERPIFKAVHRVQSTLLRHGSRSIWTAIEAGFIGVDKADIQAILDRKNLKISTYLEKCDAVWLLIVADGTHVSSTVDTDFKWEGSIETGFTRVPLYDSWNDKVIQRQ